jgi:hypothetical protein
VEVVKVLAELCTGGEQRATVPVRLSRGYFFSRRVVAFNILIHQLDELGDDVVTFERGEQGKGSAKLRSACTLRPCSGQARETPAAYPRRPDQLGFSDLLESSPSK